MGTGQSPTLSETLSLVSIQRIGLADWSHLTILLAAQRALCIYDSQTETGAGGSLPHLWREAWGEMRVEHWPASNRTPSRPVLGGLEIITVRKRT